MTVNNVPPTVDAGPDQTVYSGDMVSFSGDVYDPGTAWRRILLNGTLAMVHAIVTGSLNPIHTYLESCQDYDVTLTVKDDDGGEGSDTLTITVQRIRCFPLDIKPGSNPNSINPKNNGRIPCELSLMIAHGHRTTSTLLQSTLIQPGLDQDRPNL